MDNLSKCAFEARLNGTTYGKYMARSYVPEAIKRIEIEKPVKAEEEKVLYWHICKMCGKEFSTTHRIRTYYCSRECYREGDKRQKAEKYRDKKGRDGDKKNET